MKKKFEKENTVLRLCRRTRQENMKKKKFCAYAARYRNERAAEFPVWKNMNGTVVRMCHRHGSSAR